MSDYETSKTKLTARWGKSPQYMYWCYTCSNCKHSIEVNWWTGNVFNDEHQNKVSNYCPVCGAKMTV